MAQEQKLRKRKPKRIIKTCTDCGNAIFDDQWGEFKCKIYKIRISNPDDHAYCEHHKQIAKKKIKGEDL